MKSNLSPIKERIDPNDLLETIVNSSYPKPRWMLNESINDKTWYLSKVGINLTFYKGNINKAQKFEFKQKIADNEYLTDKINEALLIDAKYEKSLALASLNLVLGKNIKEEKN